MFYRFLLITLPLLSCLTLNVGAQSPTVRAVGREEFISGSYMEHPAIATDSKAQPHFVADFGFGPSFMKFHRIKGRWTGGVFASGVRHGRYDASRLYIGQIEIDSKDRAWISCKTGVKEFGDMYGQGVWLFRDVDTNPYPIEQFFRFVCVYKGMGLVSIDAKYPDQGVVLGTFGNWEKINDAGKTLGKGSINAGHGGEKVRFRIASYAPRFPIKGDTKSYPDGVWHTAMCGSSSTGAGYYQNSIRFKAGLGPVWWAAYSSYRIMGDDYYHPGVGIDTVNPKIAYIAGVFNGRLCLNVWNGSRMLFNPYSLKILDYQASFEGRHSVQFAPTPVGGCFVFWSAQNVIKMVYLSPDGSSTAPSTISAGRSPGAATDRYGNIHLVYYNDGIKYRKILISTLRAIKPNGTLTGARTPLFKWTDTDAATYTVELTQDGKKQSAFAVPALSWTPGTDLPVGSYSWRVKEGWPASGSTWSQPMAFTIPPAIPEPLAPTQRVDDALVPVFEWTATDPATTRYTIELFKKGVSLGTLKTTGQTKDGDALTAEWTGKLRAGSYSWRLKASRTLAGHTVSSDWSVDKTFEVLVPGPTAVIPPGDDGSLIPGKGTVTCAWTPADGVSTYKLKVLYNGSLLNTYSGLTDTNYALTRCFQPGYHVLLVQPRNSSGQGAWSAPLTFLVSRHMRPADAVVLDHAPYKLVWTRTKDATRYLAKLARYNSTSKSYVMLREKWISQSPFDEEPFWKPKYDFPNGSYRWVVTDYFGAKQGYTSAAYFRVKK